VKVTERKVNVGKSFALIVPVAACLIGCVKSAHAQNANQPPSVSSQHTSPVFSDDFESGQRGKPRNGFGWGNSSKNVTITDGFAHNGSHSLRFLYKGKPDCRDASSQQRFRLGRPLNELWLEWFIFYPKGGEGLGARWDHRDQSQCKGGEQIKFLRVWGDKYDPTPVKAGISLWRSKHGRMGDTDAQIYFHKPNGRGGWGRKIPGFVTDNASTGGIQRGEWSQVRVFIKLADVGKENGVVIVWIDGKIAAQNSNIPLYDASGAQHFLRNGYLLGWSNGGFDQDTPVYIDDFKIYDANPGWKY
jgi:hypothetical protein